MENIDVKETPMLDFVILIYKNIKPLVLVNGVVAILALLYALSLDLTYQSTAVVAIQGESSGAGLASMLSEAIPFSMGLGGGSDLQKYMGILTTRRVLDVVIQEFGLQKVYEKETLFETYKAVLDNLAVYDREDGTFSISYLYDNEPEKARDIVTTFYNELTKIALELNQNVAVNYRAYIEDAYQKAASELSESEIALSQFQLATGVLKIDDQISATISAISDLEMIRVEKEIELEYLKQTLDSANPEIKSKTIEVGIVNQRINDMKQGGESFLLAKDDIPDQSMAFYRRFRDVTVKTKIAEFLALQLQQAKIEELKGTVDIYLLDPPQVPDRKIKPKRLSIIIIILFFSGVISLAYIVIREYYRSNKDLIASRL